MKTVQISVERNFHILNDDRFIMEKIGMTVELENDDSATTAISMARQTIENNFKLAYPKVEDSLNFHVVRQMKPDYNELNWYGLKDNAPIHEGGKKLCKLPTNAEFDERNDDLKLPTTIPEKINKGTIEEQIDNKFNLLEEINKTATTTFLKVFKPMCKTEEEKKAYDERFVELSAKEGKPLLKTK